MEQHEIIEMARQAELDQMWELTPRFVSRLDAFAKLVEERTAAKEREAAGERVVDLFTDVETPYLPDIVKAIRARGEA